MISRDTLKRLAGIRSQQGTAISFYFKSETPQNLTHQTESILVKDKIRELLGSLNELQRTEAGSDLQRILKMSETLKGNNSHLKAIFACKEHDLWEEFDLAAPNCVAATQLRMGKTFELVPLLAGPLHEPRCCIVVLDREKTRVFKMQDGAITEHSDVIDEEPREVRNTGTGASSHFERQKEEEVKQHFKFVAEHLLHFLEHGDYDRLTVGCRPELWPEIEPKLHSSLKQILVERFDADPGMITVEEVRRRAREALEKRRQVELLDLIRTIDGESQRGGLAAVGIQNVFDALEKGEVEAVLIGETRLGPAARCCNCGHIVAGNRDQCEICGRNTLVFDDAVECLIRHVLTGGNIDLEVLPGHPQLKSLGGVVARLRFRADQNTPQKLAG